MHLHPSQPAWLVTWQAICAGYFLTNIFHPNVSKSGEICVNTLKRDWVSTMGLRHILVVVRCLLIEPNPESALNEEAGKLLLEDYKEYFSRAQLMTSIHAQSQRRYAAMSALQAAALCLCPPCMQGLSSAIVGLRGLTCEHASGASAAATANTASHLPCVCRSIPLSAATGASAVNAQADHDPDAAHDSSGAAVGIKKPKGVEKAKVSNPRKRGLKRL